MTYTIYKYAGESGLLFSNGDTLIAEQLSGGPIKFYMRRSGKTEDVTDQFAKVEGNEPSLTHHEDKE